ncbi:MAG: NAD-dependent succinate-semialdehyde dehydrogenase [Rhizobiaceae bacterium]|nr:NAD-dependent succinate-semialdehyde dehydrogenase [Rhizobiaceae bacterium]
MAATLAGSRIKSSEKKTLGLTLTNKDFAYPDTKLYVDGVWRESYEGAAIDVIDPASGRAIGKVALASINDLDAALESTERGFAVWSDTSAFERSGLMRRAADILRSRVDATAHMLTREQGKPLPEAKGEILAAADVIDWFAEEARRTYGQHIPSRSSGVTQMTIKMPVGPVAAFTPWNFPINQAVRKLAGALAAGCSIILKAPEETPASPAELVRAFVDAGLPSGVINLVFGEPAQISTHLVTHPTIQKISFTGSTAVGKELAALAGRHMKLATMELGGHAPVIVCADADIASAVKVLVASKYLNAGQVCVSPTRFLVQDDVYDGFVDAFVDASRSRHIGNGMELGTQMGPLANDRRIAMLETLIEDAVGHGGHVRTGGHRIGNEGFFFEPTVLGDVQTGARIMNEEPFGPICVINRFSTLNEAIEEANRLPYGLASFGFTQSSRNAHEIAMRVRSGMTTINHNGLALPEVPFGGIMESGHGTEGGSVAIEAYLYTKLITSAAH